MTKYLYAMHDPGGEHLFADRKGWIVFTEAVGNDPNDKSGRDYRQWSDAGYGVLVRVNNGYGSTGTIPTSDQYGNFAWRVAHFIAASKGCDTWIIGNETNHSQERPNGQTITPPMYIDCFKQVHAAVSDHAGTRHGLIPAPVALWNVESGDWLEYQAAIWEGLWQLSAGVAIHTYSHGPSPSLITSPEKMGAPYQDRFYHFQAYRDLMARVPQRMRGLPAYITETDQNDPWVDNNTGWVQAAYAEIDRWNKSPGTQKIYCLALYRWPKHDQWSIVDKPGVQADLRAAVARGFASPTMGDKLQDTFLPQTPNESPSVPALPPRNIDPRLTQRGVTIETPQVAPGQAFWRVVAARWYDEQQAGGRHHIYVEAPDGMPFHVKWPSGNAVGFANGRGGFDAGNFPMSPSRNEFSVDIGNGVPSEVVTGIGMGAETPSGFNPGIHTSTGVVFQLVTMPVPVGEAPPAATSPGPAPAIAYVIAQAGANLRQTPDVRQGNIILAVPHGETVTIAAYKTAGNGTRWAQVTYQGASGWMAADLLGATEPEPLPKPVEPAPSVPQPSTPMAAGIIDPRVAQAILQIESGGRTHGENGKPLIRFEAHIFKTKLGNNALWAQYFKTDLDRPWLSQEWRSHIDKPWTKLHTGSQGDEYAALSLAQSLAPEAAYQSISMGAGQLMGFNHARLGYPSAQAMFKAFQDAQVQTIAFINFFLSDAKLMEAMRNKDWREIAKRYNGAGAVDTYAPLLEKAYNGLAA